jgi:hypothetical protein
MSFLVGDTKSTANMKGISFPRKLMVKSNDVCVVYHYFAGYAHYIVVLVFPYVEPLSLFL